MKSTSPWSDINAFEPMFDEAVIVTAERERETLRQTIYCCVFSDCTGETLYEGSVDTDRQDIQVVCNERDWKFAQSLQTGDKLERPSTGMKYVVSNVRKDAVLGWVIAARSA